MNGCTASKNVNIVNKQGSIGSYVWEDLNANGINDEPNSAGIGNVSVELWKETFSGSGVFVFHSSTITSSSLLTKGQYQFDICESGNYKVKFPAQFSNITTYYLTQNDTSYGIANNSDPNKLTGESAIIVIDLNGVGIQKDNMTIDAGYIRKACVGDLVWNDNNQNGIQDAGELGIAGISVSLFNQNNQLVSSMMTDAYGHYQFCDLIPDGYYVRISRPANYILTIKDSGANDLLDNDFSNITSSTDLFTLESGSQNMSVDAGLHFVAPTTASIGNFVWMDVNQNGIQDVNETGVAGVVVSLYNNNEQLESITVTDANGLYTFSELSPGLYTLQYSLLPGLVFSPQIGTLVNPSNSDVDPATGYTISFALSAGDNFTFIDAGVYPVNQSLPLLGGIGDMVWFDANSNGMKDYNEIGVPNITVTLYEQDGLTAIRSTTTNQFGNYIFNELPQGEYIIGFSNLPSEHEFTSNSGLDSTTNSDVIVIYGKTNPIYLSAGQYNLTIDAGIVSTNVMNTNSIGDLVWNDLNKNGIKDSSEEGVVGVRAILHNSLGIPIDTTFTNRNGLYLFPSLPNGTYYVTFGNLPYGYVFTSNSIGGDNTIDSDADSFSGSTFNVILTGNLHVTDLDAGVYLGSSHIGLASLGDVVWYDLNGDGLQGPGEYGVQGVKVILYESDGITAIDSTTTDPLGKYIFTSLEKGSYVIGFDNLPTGVSFSPKHSDNLGINGDINSDINPQSGKTDIILLSTSEDKMTVDGGLIPSIGTCGLGNKVWFDLNQNGLQEPGEIGVQGISITLYTSSDSLLASTTTNANGEYYFLNLNPGTYQVKFGNLPEGYEFTTYNADNEGLYGLLNSDVNSYGESIPVVLVANEYNNAIDAGITTSIVASVGDYVWLDIDGNGIQNTSEPGVQGILVTLYQNAIPVSSTITKSDGHYVFTNLQPGAYTISFSNIPAFMEFTIQGVDSTSNEDSNPNRFSGMTSSFNLDAGMHNATIDAGLRNIAKGTIGNLVWHDFNQNGLQDSSEPGMPGVLVTLYDSDGITILANTITDGNGNYSFDNLNEGNYFIGLGNLPLGAVPTLQVGTLNDLSNSDIQSDWKTSMISLVYGEINRNIDAGIYFGVPLPVRELLATIVKQNTATNLSVHWLTREEENTSHFIIERSVDAIHFESVASTLASLTTKGVTFYHINDDISEISNEKMIYYRVKLVDNDGKFLFSNTISHRPTIISSSEFSIYPVPFSNDINLAFYSEDESDLLIEMSDLNGKLVFTNTLHVAKGLFVHQFKNLGHLSASCYQLRIKDLNTGLKFIRKVCKE